MKKPPSDDELLSLLHQVEQQEDKVDELARQVAEATTPYDPCPFCGEPAQHLAACNVCQEEGCLPGDEWIPGQRDPCMTLCVRCARDVHLACASEDEAGNPRCPSCAY